MYSYSSNPSSLDMSVQAAMQLVRVYLSRANSGQSWGFTLQGGVEEADGRLSPLLVKLVQPASVAARAGLQAGDVLRAINERSADAMRHDEAKAEILRSGDQLQLLLERVSPQSSPQSPRSQSQSGYDYIEPAESDPLAAATSRAGLVLNTDDGRTKRVFVNDYNTPIGLYSASNVEAALAPLADTVAAAASVAPAGGSGSMRCVLCGEPIKRQLVRISAEKLPAHPDCLKCCKCGIGLRSRGYFFLGGKLYCDTHAKLVSRPDEAGVYAVVSYK